MSTVDERVRELGQRWADAERDGDNAALDSMTTEDFTLVGPLGFVLEKQWWLDRYCTGIFVTKALEWGQIEVRDYGAFAIAIGIHEQDAEYQGNPSTGRFLAPHIAVRNGDAWLLAAQVGGT